MIARNRVQRGLIHFIEMSKEGEKANLVFTSGELEHSASKDTLLLPSIASRSISVATNNSSCSNQEIYKRNEMWKRELIHQR